MFRSVPFKQVAPLFFAIIVDIMGFGIAIPVLISAFSGDNSPFFPLHTPESIRLLYLGIALAIYPFFIFFGASYLGDLSDKIGRKKVLVLSLAGVAVGFFIMGLSINLSSVGLLLVGRALAGLCAGSQPAALASIADIATPENKPVLMGFVPLANALGLVLGPFLGGFFTDKSIARFFGYEVPFYVAMILAIIVTLWIEFGFRESFVPKGKKQIDWLRCFKLFYEAAKHRQVRVISIAFFCMQLGLSFFLQLILLYLHQAFKYSAFALGIYNGFIGLGFFVSMLFFLKPLMHYFPVRWVITVCLAITGIIEMLIGRIDGEVLLWVLGFCLALSNQIAFSGMFTCYSDAVSKEHQGWVMGISSAVLAVTYTIAGFETNLVNIFSILNLIFFGGILMFISFLIFIYYSKWVYKPPLEN